VEDPVPILLPEVPVESMVGVPVSDIPVEDPVPILLPEVPVESMVEVPVPDVPVEDPVPILLPEVLVESMVWVPVPDIPVEDPVPILLPEVPVESIVGIPMEDPVPILPVTLNGSVMTVKLEDPVAMSGKGQHGRHTHCWVGGGTSANKTSIEASMLAIKMLNFPIMSPACEISSSVNADVNLAD